MGLTALWWWIDRWRKSTAYTDMTLEEQGAYRNLLDEACLRGGPLPNEDRVLAKACGDPRRWAKVRGPVLLHFVLEADGCWHNATLEDVIARSAEIRAARAEAGRNGGLAKASKRLVNTVANGQQTTSKPPGKTLANTLAPDPIPSETSSPQGPSPPNARSKRPIFKGNRLVIFEWQLEDLTQMLGSFADSFKLDLWFDTLDKRAMASGEVMPKRDGGRWLMQETLAEVRRRALPIAGETEADPYANFSHAWTCRQCGNVHEGTREQARTGACTKLTAAHEDVA